MKPIHTLRFGMSILAFAFLIHASAHAYYHPSTGRWLSRDPQTEKGGHNLYAAAANTPTIAVDPLGLEGLQFRSDGHTFFDATWFVNIRIHDESGTQNSSLAFINQWGSLLQTGSRRDPLICNSTIQQPPAHHPNSYVRAEIKNTSKCPARVSCYCLLTYSIGLWSPTAKKAADIFGHILGFTLDATYPPANIDGEWMARGSATKSAGQAFVIPPGKSRELYYAAPNLATAGPGSGFEEKADGACKCSLIQ